VALVEQRPEVGLVEGEVDHLDPIHGVEPIHRQVTRDQPKTVIADVVLIGQVLGRYVQCQKRGNGKEPDGRCGVMMHGGEERW